MTGELKGEQARSEERKNRALMVDQDAGLLSKSLF